VGRERVMKEDGEIVDSNASQVALSTLQDEMTG